MGTKKSLKHALSFDIEDWFHIPGIPHVERRGNWEKYSQDSLVEEKTLLILDILEKNNTKATFFVLGWIADKYPDLVKEIARRDHEIASHGYWHYRVYTLSRTIFKNYLEQSIEVLESVTGKRVKGFRAPSFSIVPGTEWAFEVMQEVGLEYDASLFPAQRGYGGYNVDQYPQLLPSEISQTNFIELPMSVLNIGRYNVPFSGGGYLRFWPDSILKYGFNTMEKKGHPAVVYLHPRDFDKDCPREKMSSFKRFKCYYNLESTERKLQMLLENYEFGTCEEVLKNWFQVSSLKDLYQEADLV